MEHNSPYISVDYYVHKSLCIFYGSDVFFLPIVFTRRFKIILLRGAILPEQWFTMSSSSILKQRSFTIEENFESKTAFNEYNSSRARQF